MVVGPAMQIFGGGGGSTTVMKLLSRLVGSSSYTDFNTLTKTSVKIDKEKMCLMTEGKSHRGFYPCKLLIFLLSVVGGQQFSAQDFQHQELV